MNSTQSDSDRPGFVKQRKLVRVFAYWFNLIVQPAIAVGFIIGLAWLFGYMQRNHDWFKDSNSTAAESSVDENAQYACSMLCVFTKAPGRCPVCGMDLQKIELSGDPKDVFGVTIDPVARRLANIKTVAALNKPVSKAVEALGRVVYDETLETTISAWVDGRIEKLMVDYTGATIRQGDDLAVIYSPDLYTDQVGLLQARKAASGIATNQRVDRANQRMYESARRRLIEQGIPESQLAEIESSGKATSRVRVPSPVAGTVVKKLVEEGSYVRTGMPILKIADLSTVWLMLEMYPEDTSTLMLGQSVSIEIQSQIGKSYEGKVSFIDPMVDPQTQTVNVRVVIPNEAGLIKIGDFGKATISSSRDTADEVVVVPRESVLINGSNSIAYVETKPGRFEFRRVTVSEVLGDQIAIAEGIRPGEMVVASGAFMLDSTFNIQGKVSLIDPNRAVSVDQSQLARDESEAREIEAAFSELSKTDRELAEAQVICPVTEVKLGTMGMGAPIRIELEQQDVMICCAGCETNLRETPEKYLAILASFQSGKLQKPEVVPGSGDSPTSELPQMELPQMELPQMEAPE